MSLGLVLVLGGCSHAAWLAAGPAASTVQHGKPTYGAEVLAREAAGESKGTGLLALEADARLLVTSERQLLGVGVGPAWFGSFGRARLTLDATPMLGFEHVPGSALTVGTLRGGLGLGYAFDQNTEYLRGPWMLPDFVNERSESTALTLELTGSVDAPVTRAADFSVGVLVGVLWLEQWHTVKMPGPPLGPFGFGPWRLIHPKKPP